MGESDFGSLVRLSAAAGIEPSGPRAVSRTDMDVAAALVPNLAGAGRAVDGGPPVAMLLDGLVAPEEADELIRLSETLGFRQIVKSISDNYEQQLPSRTHLRCIIHSTALAEFLWPRIAPHIPAEFSGREGTFRAVRLNPCFRAMRYLTCPGKHICCTSINLPL